MLGFAVGKGYFGMSGFSNDKLEQRLKKQIEAGLERCLPDPNQWAKMVNLADNDYLGLAHHHEVKAAAQKAIDEHGCSS